MICTDKDALICDLAETYKIYNYQELPVSLLATLSVGLRENSRIKMKINDMKLSLDTIINILILDSLNMLRWQMSGNKKNKKPVSIYSQIMSQEKNKDILTFNSAEEWELKRNELLGRR